MSAGSWIQFQSPWMLLGSGIFAIFIVGIVFWRRLGLPRTSVGLAALGLALLCLGSGGVALKWSKSATVVVMVDVSPSTRGARYREAGFLRQRVGELLGRVPVRVIYFSDHNVEGSLEWPPGEPGGVERTVFAPPEGGEAIVLFSDGQFELPAVAPRVFAVVDPLLEEPADAAVAGMEQHGDRVVIETHVRGGKRELRVEGENPRVIAPPGEGVVVSAQGKEVVEARFEAGDRWPENDGMGMSPLREENERWWVGAGVPEGWRGWTAEQLPADAAAYLGPSVIVLNNVAARRLAGVRQQRLEQYVRDLGGGLVMVGGDQAFAAGGYGGSRLEELSPLSSHAPRAMVHWILLADASGSMAQSADGSTRWELAQEAMRELVGQLPPEDLLSIGSFSDRVAWWSRGKSVRETGWPGVTVTPHGPTNLAAVLEGLRVDDGLPKRLLLVTDGQAPPPEGEKLVEQFKKLDVHLHVLAIGRGEAMGVLREVARRTGGSVVEQIEPKKWVSSAEELLRGSLGEEISQAPVKMQWSGPGEWAGEIISAWNRTWLKPGANLWGKAQGEEIPLAAQWQVGLGKVAALAFAASGEEVERVARQVTQPPRDPRWRVYWEMGPQLEVVAESAGGEFVNEAPMALRIVGQGGQEGQEGQEGQAAEGAIAIPQTGPGRYEVRIDAPRSAVWATVAVGSQVLDRRALAGRYAAEFAAIGNNLNHLHDLAERSGGKVIEPGDHGRIELEGAARVISLRNTFLFMGAMLILGAAVRWRMGWVR